MRGRYAITLLLLLGLLALPGRGAGATSPARTHRAGQGQRSSRGLDRRHGQASYGHPALSFEANQGQAPSPVKFLARGSGYTTFLTPSQAVFVFRTKVGKQVWGRSQRLAMPIGARWQPARVRETVVRMSLAGSRKPSQIEGLGELPGKVNYFIGNNPRRWHTDIPTYARVTYRDVYPGVDLVYRGSGGNLEYDFVVAPHASTGSIRLRFQGGYRPSVDSRGNLLLKTALGDVEQARPVVYQQVGGSRRPVTGCYRVEEDGLVGFAIGKHSAASPLVIDPTLLYSTFLGGSGADGALAIAVDSRGDAFVTGDTQSIDFPRAHPAQSTLTSDPSCVTPTLSSCTDAFISELSPDGSSLLYSSYLGGTLDDFGYGVAIDASGSAYVTGNTLSPDFPTQSPYQPRYGGGSRLGDAFVTKLSPAGDRLVYSTYLGGSGDEIGEAIAVSGSRAYVTGSTKSANFPTVKALQPAFGGGTCNAESPEPCSDAFVTELDPSGSRLLYSTYLGGNSADSGLGIAVRNDRAYVAGTTLSTNFPTAGALQASLSSGDCGTEGAPAPCTDAFVAELTANGSGLVFNTYLGGNGNDRANGLAVDSAGNIYVAGQTRSTNFPLAHALQSTGQAESDMAFVTKLAANGTSLVFSTYLGGTGGDEAYGVAVDVLGNVYVTGSTMSLDFPTHDPVQAALPVTPDNPENVQNAFVTKLNADGNGLVYSTYLGGADHDLGADIAVDGTGTAYVTGFATSSDFPTAHAFQGQHQGGGFDAYVAKIGDPNAPALVPPTPTPTATATPKPSPTVKPKHKKRACKKGYKLVHGKCRKGG